MMATKPDLGKGSCLSCKVSSLRLGIDPGVVVHHEKLLNQRVFNIVSCST
jgi:hypothetical protein